MRTRGVGVASDEASPVTHALRVDHVQSYTNAQHNLSMSVHPAIPFVLAAVYLSVSR